MKRRLSYLLIVFGFLVVGPGPAQAGIITFDDLPAPDPLGSLVPNGYAGLQWNNFYYLNGTSNAYNPSGYQAGVVSPNNVAFNGFAQPASISSSTPFDFFGTYVTGAWNDGVNVEIQGWKNGVLTYDIATLANSTGPTAVPVSFLGVDTVTFISSGGTPSPVFGPGGSHIVLDNIAINTSLRLQGVPEPTSLALLGAGGALCGLAAWRRRRRTQAC
jgi:hypothetical protein